MSLVGTFTTETELHVAFRKYIVPDRFCLCFDGPGAKINMNKAWVYVRTKTIQKIFADDLPFDVMQKKEVVAEVPFLLYKALWM